MYMYLDLDLFHIRKCNIKGYKIWLHNSGEQLSPHASCFANICSNQAEFLYNQLGIDELLYSVSYPFSEELT